MMQAQQGAMMNNPQHPQHPQLPQGVMPHHPHPHPQQQQQQQQQHLVHNPSPHMLLPPKQPNINMMQMQPPQNNGMNPHNNETTNAKVAFNQNTGDFPALGSTQPPTKKEQQEQRATQTKPNNPKPTLSHP